MSNRQIVIYTAANLPQAHILRNVLEELGIPATIGNDAVQFGIGELPAGWSTAPRVIVAERHAELARRVALEFDAPGRSSQFGDEGEEASEASVRQEHDLWPRCPNCGSRREAVCAYCGASGNDFSPADVSYQAVEEPGEDPESLELPPDKLPTGPRLDSFVCPTCEEPFPAQYERICDKCGHDFGEGFERSESAAARLSSPWRFTPVLIGLAASALLLQYKPVLGTILLLVVGVATIVRLSLATRQSL